MAGRIDLFERASAADLQQHTPTFPSDNSELAARIGRIRRSLSFDQLPENFPLLTSRELAQGAAVNLSGARGKVISVDEAFLAVSASDLAWEIGMIVPLTAVHGREATYSLRCRLLAVEKMASNEMRLVLAHDEAPSRVQRRQFARVEARGALELSVVPTAPFRAQKEETIVAQLADLSAGGLLADSPSQLPVGISFQATFSLLDMKFSLLTVVVLECAEIGDGRHRIRLEFQNLATDEEAELTKLVSRLGARPK